MARLWTHLAALALTVSTAGALALGARCMSLTSVTCSVDTLLHGGPSLDVPYASTRPEVVNRMLDLARVGPGSHVVDLGTGDGRIAIAAAQRGATALGVDLDPVLIDRARAAATRAGVADRVRFEVRDIFETPVADADAVTMFLLPEVNLRLRPRLLSHMPPGAHIVSHAFDMGDWKPDATARVGGSRLYHWTIPSP